MCATSGLLLVQPPFRAKLNAAVKPNKVSTNKHMMRSRLAIVNKGPSEETSGIEM